MYNGDIMNMDFKRLREEVQYIRDELAVLKREYEDAIYNLDNSNFSSSVIREKDNMKAEIRVTAGEIKTKVSAEEVDSRFTEAYSAISQTAYALTSVVSKTADIANAVEIRSLAYATDKDKIYVIRSGLSETYYYYSEVTDDWKKLTGDSIYTVFNQTATGFSLKGNVSIDGDLITTGTIDADRISTEISRVAKTLYIGESSDTDVKTIKFGESMTISGITDGFPILSACRVNASGVYFTGLNDEGENTPRIKANGQLLATQDWVTANAVSGGTVTVVFG